MAECEKTYYKTVIDPGCGCCSYITKAAYTEAEYQALGRPQSDGAHEYDWQCECEEDHP